MNKPVILVDDSHKLLKDMGRSGFISHPERRIV
jgi:hypothetical protein